MAGTIVHLMVAQRLWSEFLAGNWYYSFDRTLKADKDYFFAGNICPDGIMARKNYERCMKLHSHFRDGIPDGSFDKPGMVPLFEKRMRAFWEEHIPDEKICPGLYLGYVTHMMTDERFVLQERPKFFYNIAKTGLTQVDKETFLQFNQETDFVDFRLLREFPELQDVRQSLERVPEYEIKGMITKEELAISRKWILQHFFYGEYEREEAKYLEYDGMLTFIHETTQEIMKRLSQEEYLVKK